MPDTFFVYKKTFPRFRRRSAGTKGRHRNKGNQQPSARISASPKAWQVGPSFVPVMGLA